MGKSIIIALIALCVAPLVRAQAEGAKQSQEKSAPAAASETSGSFTPLRMSTHEAIGILMKLRDARDIPIQFEPDQQSPVRIRKAVVRSVVHEASGTSHQLIEPRIELVNETDQAVTAVRLEFTLTDEEGKSLGHTFQVFIKPGESKPLSSALEYVSPFVISPGNPEKLKVRVGGAEFGKVRVWGLLPASPKMILIDTTVDSNPVLLNRPRPNYTDRARWNGVQGTIQLRVIIDETGVVKMVYVLKGLPDGLTEEAIKAAYKLKFKPAMKGGKPVLCWRKVSMDFNLMKSPDR